MLLTILLLLTISPSEIKQQTQKHLMALQRTTAIERTIGEANRRVAVFGGKQVQNYKPPFNKIVTMSAWFELLRQTQVLKWQGEGPIYTFKDTCAWEDYSTIEALPCTGEIYTEGLDVTRIIQRIDVPRWGRVVLDLRLGWKKLSVERLVPVEMSVMWKNGAFLTQWTDYQEFRATEPVVRELEP